LLTRHRGVLFLAMTAVAHDSSHTVMVLLCCLQVDDHAEKVCVLGWGPNSLMVDLIKELDHGLSALPKGSEVVFVNMHSPHDSLGQALQHVSLENVQVRQHTVLAAACPGHVTQWYLVQLLRVLILGLYPRKLCWQCSEALLWLAQVRHLTANPLQRSSLASALDVSLFRCALVLCDELWVDPDNNDANGLDSLDEPSVLRLDSMVMVAQVNLGLQCLCRYDAGCQSGHSYSGSF
jgi:hypothetical protein